MSVVHVASVVIALTTGAWLLLSTKGTKAHRTGGWVYIGALIVTAASSFAIYEVRAGRPSVFHAVSVLIVTVIAAGAVAIRRRRNQRAHLVLMSASYLMMVITGIAQFFDQLPLPSDVLNAIVFLQLPSVVGFALIWRARSRTNRPTAPTTRST